MKTGQASALLSCAMLQQRMSLTIPSAPMATIAQAEWQRQSLEHQDKMLKLAGGSIKHDRSHPIFNFLFEYYSFKSSTLLRYSPGHGVFLEGADQDEHASVIAKGGFVSSDLGGWYDPHCCSAKVADNISWIRSFLAETSSRPPKFFCFGLHEWAMLYAPPQGSSSKSQHQNLPLRVSQEELNRLVEEQPLRCTHFDAFRFFTPEARPLNNWELSRATVNQHETPACVHSNMDLFKWALKMFPWVPSSLVADCFELAVNARKLDMRASPYDISKFHKDGELDLSPITVENEEGRKEYQVMQHELYLHSLPIRAALLEQANTFLESRGSQEHHAQSQGGG
ncbi:unnamed protein product [Chrysoparadoxa australica]